jgi:hypothetical protein
MFKGLAGLPVKVTLTERSWQGATLTFALTAKFGFMSTPIHGTVEVTDDDVTVDADLGLLAKMVPEATVREMVGSRIKGLLK